MYLTSQEIPLRQALTVPCYWWGNWSPERLDDLIQVTKLGSGHMSWASNPDRCPSLWLLRQKGMLMSSKWRIVSKWMKVASGIESLWEQYPMAFAHNCPEQSLSSVTVVTVTKWNRLQIPHALPDPTAKAPSWLVLWAWLESGLGLLFPILPAEGKPSGGSWNRPSEILRAP